MQLRALFLGSFGVACSLAGSKYVALDSNYQGQKIRLIGANKSVKMFFYRAWLISGAHSSQPDYLQNQVTAFDFAKWIYLALLVATVLVCSGLNFAFLISFIQNGMGGFRKIPNVVFICMSLRDLIVCAVLIPICIDWYVIENGVFAGGFILCKFTGFLDYWMLAQYPILIIVFGVILLTRKFPKPVSLL